ncbi:hypothetical protein H5392_07325 [Tessaracoccus sp. MC1865]|uniref:hypothetical protein n=1 Tax=Tessaracoccus sp. MC1865 TaxID=2760310 RepID=UPI0016019773|nr:hypothetical protein [Tessaracoccus sp. MC1865]MBB1483672.1 hypothetical protein [Tessaracoccus sp. MC1865]QTO36744.1 hypothetical protein J7D54_09700 [Tessaracoccus sp. MC1865]
MESVWRPPADMDADEWLDWTQSLSGVHLERHRDAIMIEGLKAGCTLQAVGDVFGVSRERVRQIAAVAGVNMGDLRAEQRAARERRERRVARHVIGASLAHPEMTVDELAEWLDLDTAVVRRHLAHRRPVHEPQQRDGSTRVSPEELLSALAEWGAQTHQHTGDDYSEWAKARGLPGKQTVAIRLGSWNEAMALAGLGQYVGERGGTRPVISDEELWASLVEFLTADLESYSFLGYENYARSSGLGSGALVRQRLGGWSDVLLKVRDIMRYAADRDASWAWAESILDVVPGDAPRNVVTHDDALASLGRVASLFTGPVTVQAYETHRQTDDAPAPLIQRRCGSWIAALVEAGLSHRMSAKARGKLERGEMSLPLAGMGGTAPTPPAGATVPAPTPSPGGLAPAARERLATLLEGARTGTC